MMQGVRLQMTTISGPDDPTAPRNGTRGSCIGCGNAYIWPKAVGPLYRMRCPIDGSPLDRTSHQYRGPWYALMEIR